VGHCHQHLGHEPAEEDPGTEDDDAGERVLAQDQRTQCSDHGADRGTEDSSNHAQG